MKQTGNENRKIVTPKRKLDFRDVDMDCYIERNNVRTDELENGTMPHSDEEGTREIDLCGGKRS